MFSCNQAMHDEIITSVQGTGQNTYLNNDVKKKKVLEDSARVKFDDELDCVLARHFLQQIPKEDLFVQDYH